jgi:hypothetical protein
MFLILGALDDPQVPDTARRIIRSGSIYNQQAQIRAAPCLLL